MAALCGRRVRCKTVLILHRFLFSFSKPAVFVELETVMQDRSVQLFN